mmetsp:Transcript_21204/g.26751  ORF Transcript_21204/g.26751 Transcript_21204/m.26751 type:complete len:251 (-) Transcript_21204:1068-1820(-)
MKQLRIVHLKEHTGDFTGKFWLGHVNEWVQPFTNHVLLHLWCCRCQGGCSKGFIRSWWWWCSSCSRRCLLLRHRSWCHCICTSIASLLIKFDTWLSSTSTILWTSTSLLHSTSPSAALLHTASSTSYLLWHTLVSHTGVSSWLPRLSHHRVSSTAWNTTSSRTSHHLRHHGVGRLHATTWSRPVHWHVRITHRSHRTTSHDLSWTSSLGMLSFKLSSSDIPPLSEGNKDRFVSKNLSIHFVHCTSGFLRG